MIEVRDLMITINLTAHKLHDCEKKEVGQEAHKEKDLKHWEDLIRIEYVGLKYVFPSKGLKHSIGPHKRNNYDHMLMPRLDDEGDVNGSCLMYCLAGYEMNPI